MEIALNHSKVAIMNLRKQRRLNQNDVKHSDRVILDLLESLEGREILQNLR